MGKRSKQKTTTEPSAYAKGYITPAANALQSTYGSTQARANEFGDMLASRIPGLMDSAFNPSEANMAGMGYLGDVLGGKYLSQGNPYLDGIVDQTRSNTMDSVQSAFGKAGRTGSGANQMVLGKALADAEQGLRYGAYNDERGRMAQAAGLLPGLEASQYAGLSPLLAAMGASTGMPMDAARGYAGGIGNLVGGYTTTTQTSQKPWWETLMNVGSSAASAYAGMPR